MTRQRVRKKFVKRCRAAKTKKSAFHGLIQTNVLMDLLLSWLQPDEVAIFSSVAKALGLRAKRNDYWMSVACNADGSNEEDLKIFHSFVSRGYSHPGYRVFCWKNCSYSDVKPDVRLESNESIGQVSCVWRRWVFDPARANGWTTERRVQVWSHYLENNYRVWYPLQKTYISGFYNRTPRNPFLLTMGQDVKTAMQDNLVLRNRTVWRRRN